MPPISAVHCPSCDKQSEPQLQRVRAASAEFVDVKLVTRATYTLDGMEGPLFFDRDGQLTFLEKDGLDYAPVTVQVLPHISPPSLNH